MTDWGTLRTHIDHVVSQEGQWVGLFDADGEYLMRLPVGEMDAKGTLRKSSDLQLTFPTVGRYGVVNRAVDRLVAEGAGQVGDDGALVPVNVDQHMIVIVREGGRRAYLTVHPTAPVYAFRMPDYLTVPGVDLLHLLSMWPAPSVPATWQGGFKEWTGDAGGTYDTPRTYAAVEFATRADGYSITGPAESVIRETVQDSFDAVNTMMGWSSDPHMVVDYGAPATYSRNASIRVADRPLLDTVQKVAADAGVVILADLWWPGDPPVTVRAANRIDRVQRTWSKPMTIITISQTEENQP